MVDPRFYTNSGPASVVSLFPDCEIRGDGARKIAGLAALGAAGAGDLTFFDAKANAQIATGAGALVLKSDAAQFAPEGVALVISAQPRAAFAQAARKLYAPRIYQLAPAIAADAAFESDVEIGANVVIAGGVKIGAGARIGPGAVIGPGVKIGRRTHIGARAVIECALIGDDVTILAGAVVGQAGFGVTAGPMGPVDLPHFGRAIIEDRVTLGANSCVDRGFLDDTIVSEDAKIDNLCHIAHNVVIGRGVLIAAYGGISGSTTIGDGAILAGRVGVVDHVTIGPGAVLTAGSSVLTSVPAGEKWGGYPAKALRSWLREVAWLARAAGGRRDVGK